jgi:hypothetical protein
MREERENETFGCCCFKTGSLYQDMPVPPFEDQDLLNFLILADLVTFKAGVSHQKLMKVYYTSNF